MGTVAYMDRSVEASVAFQNHTNLMQVMHGETFDPPSNYRIGIRKVEPSKRPQVYSLCTNVQ